MNYGLNVNLSANCIDTTVRLINITNTGCFKVFQGKYSLQNMIALVT